MEKLINYAVKLMIRENPEPEENPLQNPLLNPDQNAEINAFQNPEISASQNPLLAPSQNINWKVAWWNKFQELALWDYLNNSQKRRCQIFLKQL